MGGCGFQEDVNPFVLKFEFSEKVSSFVSCYTILSQLLQRVFWIIYFNSNA